MPAPGIAVFGLVAVGLLYALDRRKKAKEEAAREQQEQGLAPATEPSLPYHAPPPSYQPSTYQPAPIYQQPTYGYPPPQAEPAGVVDNWTRATQSDFNRDSMLPRYTGLMYSDKPVGSEVLVQQNGRWWRLKIISRMTDPSTTKDRDVRGWILPAGVVPAAAQRPRGVHRPPYPPHVAPPVHYPPHRPAPPPPHVAPYPAYPPQAEHVPYPPHMAPSHFAYPPAPHAAPAYPPVHHEAAYPSAAPHAVPGYPPAPPHAAPAYPPSSMPFGEPHAVAESQH